IPQHIAENIECQHQNQNGDAGKKRQMCFADDDMRIILLDQVSPGWSRRLRADPEKAQSAFDQDGGSKIRSGNDNDRSENIGQYLLKNNPCITETQCPCSFYKFFFAVTDELSSYD